MIRPDIRAKHASAKHSSAKDDLARNAPDSMKMSLLFNGFKTGNI